MQKVFLKIFLLIVCVALLGGCLEEEKVITPDMKGGSIKNSSVADEKESERQPVASTIEQQLKSLTLEEKIGQMIIIGIQGTELDENISYSINNFHFGGVILYDRNMQSLAQTKKLVDDIKALSSKVPLLIAIDEEGGTVVRGADFLEPAPSQESIGLSDNPQEATRWAKHNAAILRSIDVNLNFAPVADVGSRDTRSFGDDPQLVTEFVDAAAQGYEQENFLYTIKHFPGIGRSKIDPHQEVSSVEVDRATLDAEDLPPFVNMIRTHDNTRFMVMVGHLKYDALDPVNSASLSPVVITNLLRNELGFTGVIITDDLEMGAIKNNVDLSTVGVRMIQQTDSDIALVCHDYASQQAIYNGILAAVQRGEISEERIDESVRRILKLKAHLND